MSCKDSCKVIIELGQRDRMDLEEDLETSQQCLTEHQAWKDLARTFYKDDKQEAEANEGTMVISIDKCTPRSFPRFSTYVVDHHQCPWI